MLNIQFMDGSSNTVYRLSADEGGTEEGKSSAGGATEKEQDLRGKISGARSQEQDLRGKKMNDLVAILKVRLFTGFHCFSLFCSLFFAVFHLTRGDPQAAPHAHDRDRRLLRH